MAAGPCDWPLDVSQCCDDLTGEDVSTIESAVAQASALMSRLSGYTIGQCAQTLRPLSLCKRCRGWCCGGTDGIRLETKDKLPVSAVSRVRLGPTVLPGGNWRFDKETQMLWAVPPNRWPKKDPKWDEDGAGEAFSVDVVTGIEPDAWARAVGTLLACELLNSCLGRKCRIPKNATRISSQGIEITLSDMEISTLLPEVSGWVKVVNPHKAKLPARMLSPDLAPHYRGECCGRVYR